MTSNHRDFAEEMDNAMIPFRENCEQRFGRNWNINSVIAYANQNRDRCSIIKTQGGFINITTDLITAPDGSLWRVLDE